MYSPEGGGERLNTAAGFFHDDQPARPTYDRRTEPDFARRQVNAAAAFLDRLEPRWIDKMNPVMLDLCSTQYCVLGQLYGDYHIGCRALERACVAQSGWAKFTLPFDPQVFTANSVYRRHWLAYLAVRRAPAVQAEAPAPELVCA